MTWSLFSEEKPPEGKAVYWWRVAPKNFGGIVAQPQFAEELSSHWDGCRGKAVWLPRSSVWTGYQWKVPDTLEWMAASGDAKERDELWPDIELLPCPFCGGVPAIKSTQASLSGGCYKGLVITSKFWQHNWFEIKHACRAMRTSSPSTDLAGKVAAWNHRQPLQAAA